MTATPWSRFVMPWQYAPGTTGAPNPGDKLYFYIGSSDNTPGTTTPKDTYSDPTLSIPNPNPVVANQRGLWGDIFLASDVPYRVVWTDADDNEIATANPVAPFMPSSPSVGSTVVMECTVDGGTGIPITGICGDLYCPFPIELTAAVLQATTAGDMEIDVWASTFVTNTPPTVTDSIVASAPPTLSSTQSSIDTTLSGWTKTFPAGTAFRFNLNSISQINRFTLSLVATRTG